MIMFARIHSRSHFVYGPELRAMVESINNGDRLRSEMIFLVNMLYFHMYEFCV